VAGAAFGAEWDPAEQAFIATCAAFGTWLLRQIQGGEAELAMTLIDLQRRSLGGALGEALRRRLFAEAQEIMQPLDEFWNARGLATEANAWVDRVRIATEDEGGAAPDFDTPAGALWLFAVGSEAIRALRSGRLDEAERVYSEITRTLERSKSENAKRHLATAYHQLGRVAQDRGALDDAEAWYKKSLAINEALGDRPGMATSYHQLGMVAQDRGALDDAEAWYKKSLAIAEALDNRPGMASSYHQLGRVAQDRGALDAAEAWYKKSLATLEALGDRPGMALTYAQLGLLAEAREDPNAALEWTARCVTLFDQFPHPSTGPAPHHLARLTAALGVQALEDSWQRVTGRPLPAPVRDYVEDAIRRGKTG
jgi:tetratricopeptide (TPR) repeat protein